MHCLIVAHYAIQGSTLQTALKRQNIVSQIASINSCIEHELYLNTDAIIFPSQLSNEDSILIRPHLEKTPQKTPLIFIGNLQRTTFTDQANQKLLEKVIFLDESIRLQQIAELIHEIISKKTIKVDNLTTTDIQLDHSHRTIKREQHTIQLTRKEFFIMELLINNLDKITTRDNIVDYVWDKRTYVTQNTIDVYMSRLRKKLKKLKKTAIIHTTPCLGYKFIV